jgi:hypothetical protein
LVIKSLIEKLRRLTGNADESASPAPKSKSKSATRRVPEKDKLISPEQQMADDQERIARILKTLEEGKALLAHSDPKEVGRAQRILDHYKQLAPTAYGIGQIKWRLGLGDPSDDLEAAVRHYSMMLQDARQHGFRSDTYWAHLIAFVCVILSGSVPAWVARTLPEQSSYGHRKKRLTPWEINLGYQFALAQALNDGEIPSYWPRFVRDSAERNGLKRIHRNLVTYESLFRAAQRRDWDELVTAVGETDANYRKRGSSEASYADVFGDGPFNSRSIDYIAAAILRTVQNEPGFPRERISTPHMWKWGNRDLAHLAPKGTDS